MIPSGAVGEVAGVDGIVGDEIVENGPVEGVVDGDDASDVVV